MKTVLDCIEMGTRYLEERAVADARRNMQWLVAGQLGCERIDLYTQFDRPMHEDELAPLREALKRRASGEPLQHIMGTVEFCGRTFRCDRRALIPRPETEELAEAVLAAAFPRPTRLLDMGTGSGVLGLSVAAALGEECEAAHLADVSPEALALAGENAAHHGLEVTLVESDLFGAVDGTFDLIVANLPYVADADRESLAPEVRHDPPGALFAGPDGLALIRAFVPAAAERLRPGGLLAMELGTGQSAEVLAMMTAARMNECRCLSDLSGHDRFVFARAGS
ncbi:MAG: peptide chain release factor N(5)-glutamine methyltransferase [Akkermansiaceae bacterium]|nr:peptide chain release factor N(5)-glutamine methyltransferase [Akkermansiaceae bacterium]NNM28723.1 peptide chain release factor N(5)-glutamine methyltransferase [Akkermansiaceae bacterium]